MRYVIGALGLLLCAAGCRQKPDPLEGRWAELSTDQCALNFTFDNGQVRQERVCQLPTGGTGVEATIGTYVESTGTVTLTSTHSSCPKDVRESATFEFDLLGKILLLTRGKLTLRLEDAPRTSSRATAAFASGCFDDHLNFTPNSVHLLP
jgi:hypothetical protein